MSDGKFKRVLKAREVLALAFGAMIGWGWVVLTGGWIESAGSFGAMVAVSFLVLRRREPEMERPFMTPNGEIVGGAALILSLGIVLRYLPWSPAALVWPYEWAIVGGWIVLGPGFYLWSRAAHAAEADAIVRRELETGHSDI